jgi:hypothetical protein
LALVGECDDAPLELIARLAGNDGYLSVVDAIGRRDVEIAPRDLVPLANRFQEAVVRLGGSATCVAWQFPLRQAGLYPDMPQIVAAWDRTGNGRGEELFEEWLVREVRMWQPEVIVTHDAPASIRSRDRERARPFEDAALQALVHRAVLSAVARAADRGAFADQMRDGGLEPWAVKRVFGIARPGSRSGNNLSTAWFAPRLGQSLAEAAAAPRGLLGDRLELSPPTVGFRLLFSTAAEESDRQDFFGGSTIMPGGPARRALSAMPDESLDLRQRMAQKRRHVQAILEHAGRTTGSIEQLLAQIDELTRDLDEESRVRILYHLADRYDHRGYWPLAAETFELLAQRYPRHPLASSSLLWLVQYYASGEAAWRVERGDARHRLERAAMLGQEIERTRPALYAEPGIGFPLAAAYRGLEQAAAADRLYQAQTYGSDRAAWAACAQAELKRTEEKAGGHPGKATLRCLKAASKPHLDGVLDDPLWQHAKPAVLQSAQHDDGDWPAAVMLGYDAEFLYLAARCQTAPRTAPPQERLDEGRPARQDEDEAGPAMTRPRDGDLSAHDRVELLIDVDRDFTTYYRLTIDDRGWTNDRCWDDASWDPQWFVAVTHESGGWTAEAAIPLTALIGHPPTPGNYWSVGIQRVAPKAGFQSWTTPASLAVFPDGFGYLLF